MKKHFQTIKQSSHKVSNKKLRAQYEQCYIVAKKILRHFELKPELIDVFTKKQRERLLRVFYVTPVVKPDKERTVPRQYIRNINTTMHLYLKNNYWGNPENNITLIELATYGLSFLSNIEQAFKEHFFDENSPQFEATQIICKKFKRDDVLTNEFLGLIDDIYHQTSGYSKINFRIYGFSFDCEGIKKPCGCCYDSRFTVRITTKDSEEKIFTYNEIKRKAFRIYRADIGIYLPKPITIERKKIFPRAPENDDLNIYVQSHVLYRFKERMDSFVPTAQNILIQNTFTLKMNMVSFENRVLFACLIEEQPIGYFTFFVQDSNIVINTFLPLTSTDTPEGKKLHELLPLTKEELIYLGMDKTSFYLKVDFEQIPILKQALIDSKIWEAKLELEAETQDSEDRDNETPIDINKTNFVKNYFERYVKHHNSNFEP